MKIEKQVVCLELSKKLKDAGYSQKDFTWQWYKHKQRNSYLLLTPKERYLFLQGTPLSEDDNDIAKDFEAICVAPTVGELLTAFRSKENDCQDEISIKWVGGITHHWEAKLSPNWSEGATPQDALANLWLRGR